MDEAEFQIFKHTKPIRNSEVDDMLDGEDDFGK